MKIDFRNIHLTFDKVKIGELFKTNDIYFKENEHGDEVWILEDNYYIKIHPVVCKNLANKVYNAVNVHNGKLRALYQDKMVEIIDCSRKYDKDDIDYFKDSVCLNDIKEHEYCVNKVGRIFVKIKDYFPNNKNIIGCKNISLCVCLNTGHVYHVSGDTNVYPCNFKVVKD